MIAEAFGAVPGVLAPQDNGNCPRSVRPLNCKTTVSRRDAPASITSGRSLAPPRGGTVFQPRLRIPTTDLATEARCGVSAAARLLRGRMHDRVLGSSPSELRIGTLPEPPVLLGRVGNPGHRVQMSVAARVR